MERKLLKIMLFVVLLVLIGIMITSCTFLANIFGSKKEKDGDGTTPPPEEPQYYLKVRILDPINNNPIPDLIVFINDCGTNELIDSKITDSNGYVDFGDVKTDQVNLSYAYEILDQSSGDINREIVTMNNIQVSDNLVIYLLGSMDDTDGASLGTINVNLSVPEVWEFSDTYVYPMYSHSNTTSHSTVEVYASHLQTDDLLTLLGEVFGSAGSLLGYGFLIDQNFTDGQTYAINIDQDPILYSFQTTRGINSIEVYALRKGVEYDLGESEYYDPPVSSGSVLIKDKFPGDLYVLYADYSEEVNTSPYEYKGFSYSTSSSDIQTLSIGNIDIPLYQIDSIDYSSYERRVNYTTTGSYSPFDFSEVDLSYNTIDINNNYVYLYWTIISRPEDDQIYIPQLPQEINSWIDLNAVESLDFTQYDGFGIQGYNDILDVFFTGNFDIILSMFRNGFRVGYSIYWSY